MKGLAWRQVVAVAALCPAVALAHHGWSEYDASKPLKLTGTVLESGYEHPHGHVRMQMPDKTWSVILAPPSRMEQRGLSKAMLRKGASATVEGFANKSKPDEVRAERITVGGKTIELR